MSEEVKVAAVYTAIANVLSALSVEKGGSLPSNMGGKSYITAADLNSEIKRQFVENNLILLPTERETSKQVLVDTNGKKTVTISVEGRYMVVSTVDGSSAEVGGVGDGLAMSTSVSANIASTNALKNALLRTFLVTEQSVEDAAKNGVPDSAPEAVAVPVKETTATVKADITQLLDTRDAATIKLKGNEFFETEDANGWSNDLVALTKWRTHLTTGEIR